MAIDVAIRARDENMQGLVHMLLDYPVAGTDLITPSYVANGHAIPLSKPVVERFVANTIQSHADLQHARLNIISHAKLQGLPPATIINAEIDPLASDGQRLAEKLITAGVRTTHTVYPGVTHEFFGMGAAVKHAAEAQSLARKERLTALTKWDETAGRRAHGYPTACPTRLPPHIHCWPDRGGTARVRHTLNIITPNDAILHETQSEGRPSPSEAEAAIRTLIRWAGDNPDREGLRDTPRRVTKAYRELFGGYEVDPVALLERTFQEVDGYDEVVLLRDIRLESYCEHHMVPIIGRCHVAYLPRDRVVGISKLARVVDAYSKRLQIQERLTVQIASTIDQVLQPRGVGVVIEAGHQCMSTRGVHKPGVSMVTSRLTGAFRDDPSTRREFLAMIGQRAPGGFEI